MPPFCVQGVLRLKKGTFFCPVVACQKSRNTLNTYTSANGLQVGVFNALYCF